MESSAARVALPSNQAMQPRHLGTLAAERRPWSAQKTPMPAMPTDLSGDDDLSNADEEEITSTTDAEEVGEEEVLMDDQDGGVDPAEVLGTDIKKDDT